jgi:hypothetical protein
MSAEWTRLEIAVNQMRLRLARGSRAAADHLFRERQPLAWGILAAGVLAETLRDRGADADVTEAEAAIERLAAAPADEGL